MAEFVAGTGGNGAGLGFQILLAGDPAQHSRLFPALVLITLAGVAVYLAIDALARLALERWHESELPLSDSQHVVTRLLPARRSFFRGPKAAARGRPKPPLVSCIARPR